MPLTLVAGQPAFVLPEGFPLMGLGIAGSAFLHVFQFISVAKARKAAGVPYPNEYATAEEAKADPKKMKFNCAQRATANTLESFPYILGMYFFLGMFHPKFATSSMCLWVFGKIAYTMGYSTGTPAARNNNFSRLSYLGLLALFFGNLYTTGAYLGKTYLQL